MKTNNDETNQPTTPTPVGTLRADVQSAVSQAVAAINKLNRPWTPRADESKVDAGYIIASHSDGDFVPFKLAVELESELLASYAETETLEARAKSELGRLRDTLNEKDHRIHGYKQAYMDAMGEVGRLETDLARVSARLAEVEGERDKLLQAPLCADHAEAWYCERPHIKSESGCIWCDFTAQLSDLQRANEEAKAECDDLTRAELTAHVAQLTRERENWQQSYDVALEKLADLRTRLAAAEAQNSERKS